MALNLQKSSKDRGTLLNSVGLNEIHLRRSFSIKLINLFVFEIIALKIDLLTPKSIKCIESHGNYETIFVPAISSADFWFIK